MIIYPTVLYHKRHSITGLNYFGKTTRDPYKSNGSGTYWKKHIKKHGKEHIVTLWVSDSYIDSTLILEFAIGFSKDNNIVESKEWANLIEENGLDGRVAGFSQSAETRVKIAISQTGRIYSAEARANQSIAQTGKTRSDEHRANQSIAQTGKPKSAEAIAKSVAGRTKLRDILTPDGFVLEQISTKELCSRFNLDYKTVSWYFNQNKAYKGFLNIAD